MSWRKPTFLNREKPVLDRWLCAPPLVLIYLYRGLLSPFLGNDCRFHPSCSRYSREAFLRRSFPMACWLTLRRLCKCNPFHPGGYDPLDPEEESSATDDAPHPNPGPRRPLTHPGERHDG